MYLARFLYTLKHSHKISYIKCNVSITLLIYREF